MKKLVTFGLLLLAGIFLLSACSNKSDNGNKEENEPLISSKPEAEGGSMETGDGYGFVTFDLAISVAAVETVETSYDVTRKAEATYMDKRKDIDVSGNEAMDELFYLFDHMRLTKDTPEQVAIEKILEHFEINKDEYTNFKLDVEFDEGTELHIHQYD